MCDEAKSQLQIHGSFGIDSGGVSIEDTTLGVVSWSDSLIICNLPDSGKGAGGGVQVQTKKGVSNKRALSIFSMVIDHDFWYPWVNSNGVLWGLQFAQRWIVNWRADIGLRGAKLPNIFAFEVSKKSFGHYFDGHAPTYQLPWTDTSAIKDSCISLSGIMNLDSLRIDFNTARIITPQDAALHIGSGYKPLSIHFDTTGGINGYLDTVTTFAYPDLKKREDSLYNVKILFPPGIKNNIVRPSNQSIEGINIIVNEHSVAIEHLFSLGATTASLYSIDGRLLKRTKLNISLPGIFSIDVSDVHTHFAILVLQTGRGVITKKILF
jgi:hypothetical protein